MKADSNAPIRRCRAKVHDVGSGSGIQVLDGLVLHDGIAAPLRWLDADDTLWIVGRPAANGRRYRQLERASLRRRNATRDIDLVFVQRDRAHRSDRRRRSGSGRRPHGPGPSSSRGSRLSASLERRPNRGYDLIHAHTPVGIGVDRGAQSHIARDQSSPHGRDQLVDRDASISIAVSDTGAESRWNPGQ